MELSTLQEIWFLLLGVVFSVYAVLDGFDLGVGMLQIFHKTDEERRIAINSVGPVWDGNEVWLLTGGGALFAAFPHVYAGVFSGLYTALILLLGALIFRAISMEVRSKVESLSWRKIWDVIFCVCSFLIALLLGVALGNLVTGLPIDAAGNIDAGMFGLLGLLRPIPLLAGLLSVALLMLLGALYLILKTEGAMALRVISWLPKIFLATGLLLVGLTVYVIATRPVGAANMEANPWLMLIPLGAFGCLFLVKIYTNIFRFGRAFLAASIAVVLLIVTVGVGMFPCLVPANNDVANSLMIAHSASAKTLTVMFTIACIGVPIVLAYTTMIYFIFRKKTKLDTHSY